MSSEATTTTTDDDPLEAMVPAEFLASTTPVAAFGALRAVQGRGADLLEAVTSLIGSVRAEDGCEQYVVHTTDDPDAINFYERWASGKALRVHLSQSHMQSFYGSIQGLFAGMDAQWLKPV